MEHLVYASSSSVYGSNKKVPYSTDDKVDNPVSLYAATKKSNELLAHAYSKLYNIPSTGLRFFTVYGPAGRVNFTPRATLARRFSDTLSGTVNSFAQIFSCSIDIAAQVSLSASARHRNGNNSARTTFAY